MPAETAQSPHGATGRVAPLFNLCAATRMRVPRHAHEAKHFAALCTAKAKAKLDGNARPSSGEWIDPRERFVERSPD